MAIGTDTIIYIVLFIGVLLFVEGAYYLLQDLRETGEERSPNKRLQIIRDSGDARAALRKYHLEDEAASQNAIARIVPAIYRLQVQTGSSEPPLRVLMAMAGLSIALAAASEILLALPDSLDLLFAVVLGSTIPVLILLRKRKKRITKFGEQLPDALDLVVRALRAGHPTSTALTLVAREMSDPIGTEFGLAVDEMTYGRDMDDALSHMAARVPHPDLNFVISAVQIQRSSGGNLAEILANLASVIRERFRMFAKIRAVSAEGRFSAAVVGVLPLVVAGVLNVINPKYFAEVMHHPAFWIMMGIGTLCVLGGWFTTWRMVNFKV